MRYLGDIKCPICSKLMSEGYVYAGRGIFWSEDNKNSIFPFRDVKLAGSSGWKCKKELACICVTCKVVLFHYGTL